MTAASNPLHGRSYRVVRIVSRLIVGGPAHHVMNLARLAPEFPTLLVTGAVEEGEEDLLDEACRRGIDVHRIPELGRAIRPGQDAVALVKLTRLLRTVRPEIVHTHTAKAGGAGRIAALLAGVPVRVHTFHGHVFGGYFTPLANRGVIAAERMLAAISTAIVAISASQASDLTDVFHIAPKRKVRTIPLGLDLDRFTCTKASERQAFRDELGGDNVPVVSIIGRLAPVKNHRLFLRAAARMVSAGRDIRFVIVGGGSEEPALRAAVREMGLESHVRFLGFRRDLERVYAGSDVVVLCSHSEGTPVSLIEAIAAGRPVVATAVGGVPGLLEDGALGRLVPPGDAAALADAIALTIDAGADACPAAHNIARVVTSYGTERLLEDMRMLYRELLHTQ